MFMFVILTPNQIQHGGFKRASVKKIGDMIRDRVRILIRDRLRMGRRRELAAGTC